MWQQITSNKGQQNVCGRLSNTHMSLYRIQWTVITIQICQAKLEQCWAMNDTSTYSLFITFTYVFLYLFAGCFTCMADLLFRYRMAIGYSSWVYLLPLLALERQPVTLQRQRHRHILVMTPTNANHLAVKSRMITCIVHNISCFLSSRLLTLSPFGPGEPGKPCNRRSVSIFNVVVTFHE